MRKFYLTYLLLSNCLAASLWATPQHQTTCKHESGIVWTLTWGQYAHDVQGMLTGIADWNMPLDCTFNGRGEYPQWFLCKGNVGHGKVIELKTYYQERYRGTYVVKHGDTEVERLNLICHDAY